MADTCLAFNRRCWSFDMVDRINERPEIDEVRKNSILINDYFNAMAKSGWEEIHIMWAPMSSEGFHTGVVSAMQKKKILGITNRYVIVAKKQG